MVSPSSKSIFALNTLLCCIGLRMQLIDFHLMCVNVKWKYSEIFRKYRIQNIPIIFFILFSWRYLSDVSPFAGQNKRSVVFFVSYAFYIGRYLSLIVIYFFQYFNQRKLTIQQKNVRKMFIQLWSINRYLREKREARFSEFENCPWYKRTEIFNIEESHKITRPMLNVFNFRHFTYILATIMVYVVANQPR